MGPSPPLWFSAFKSANLAPEFQVSMGPRPRLWICAYKTGSLAPESQVYMGPSPHLWFLHAKQRLMGQNYKSLWVPDLTCRFLQETAYLPSETLVSMSPSPLLSFCA